MHLQGPMLKLTLDPEAAARLESLLEEHEPEAVRFNEAVVRPEEMVEFLLLAMAIYKRMRQARS